jgi:molybdopterin molybdotransferase
MTVSLSELTANLPGFRDDAVTPEQARKIIAGMAPAVTGAEPIRLEHALGRILAADVASPIDVPAHDNSAMDGYAFSGAALPETGALLQVAGHALAGHPWPHPVLPGSCVRIMTGAPIPQGCDTVAPQEVATLTGDRVALAGGSVRVHDHVRRRGEDLRAGDIALKAGRRLRAADLGLLASLGITEVTVRRRLRVALFSTGDELRSPGDAAENGSIYDSNRYTLGALLAALGCEVLAGVPVADSPAALEAALREAGRDADLIVTSGGVSDGSADYTRQAIEALGEVCFWSMAMRPGRPFAFGILDLEGRKVCLFALPGNPVAAMVAFCCIVRDPLLKMMGADEPPLPRLRVPAATAIRKRPGRTEYQRGIVGSDGNGHAQVRPTGAQGSGILRSMSEANCLIELGAEKGDVEPGQPVDVLLFDGLL